MSSFNIQVTGFDELKRKIKMLGDDRDKKKESLVLLRQVAKSTLIVAKQKVPIAKKAHWQAGKRTKKKISPGNLKKSLGIITSKSKDPTVLVGARAKNGFEGWYAHFVHENTNIYNNSKNYIVYKKKKVKRTRSVLSRVRGRGRNVISSSKKGNPFLRNAYEQTQGKVTAESEQKFAKFLQRRIDRLSNK